MLEWDKEVAEFPLRGSGDRVHSCFCGGPRPDNEEPQRKELAKRSMCNLTRGAISLQPGWSR